jgi:hypothetical protein
MKNEALAKLDGLVGTWDRPEASEDEGKTWRKDFYLIFERRGR